MRSRFTGPANVGSTEMVTINKLATMTANIAEKKISLQHVPGPQGVRGRSSNNLLIYKVSHWQPSASLLEGLEGTYHWIKA